MHARVIEFARYRHYGMRLFKFLRDIFHLKSLAHANVNAIPVERIPSRSSKRATRRSIIMAHFKRSLPERDRKRRG